MASVEVDVDMNDFHDDDLVCELEDRGYKVGKEDQWVLVSKKDLTNLYYDLLELQEVGDKLNSLDKFFAQYYGQTL